MLSWQVGRVKITRIVEMDLPVPATAIPRPTAAELRKLGDDDPNAAARTRWCLFAEWADQPILVIGTHFAAPTAGHVLRDGAAFKFVV